MYTAQSAEYSLYTGLPREGKLLRVRQPMPSARQDTEQRTALIGGQSDRNNKGRISEQNINGKKRRKY